jgi:Aspartate/tyrosine/aromatic aminotransferase
MTADVRTGWDRMAARRLSRIAVSPMGKLLARTSELRAAGIDVINLGIGEPDFATPRHIRHAATTAMNSGDTKYTTVDGTIAVKKAVQEKFHRENGLDFSLAEIGVANGAKQSLFNAIIATVEEGDEVIIPLPAWSSYIDMVELAGGTVVTADCTANPGFTLDAADLEAAITDRTKWLLLNFPNNPTGAVLGRSDLEAIAAVLVRHPHVWVLSDDIYEHLIFDGGKFISILEVEPALRGRCLIVNGVSKAYSMTGWRIGYAAGPAQLIKAMAAVQSQATSNPSSIGQAAACAALLEDQSEVGLMRAEFEKRRNLVVDLLAGIRGLSCPRPLGAFYVFPNCSDLIGSRTPSGATIGSDDDLASYLLEEAAVGVIPGSAFGASPYLRLSIAASEDALRTALARIRSAVDKLS